MNRPRISIRAPAALLGVVALLVLSACGAESDRGWDAESIGRSVQDRPFQPVVVNSNLGVGTTRLAIGLFDKADGSLVPAATVTVRLFWLGESTEDFTNAVDYGEFGLRARKLDIDEAHQDADPSVFRSSPDQGSGAQQPIGLFSMKEPVDSVKRHDGALTTMFTTMVGFDRPGSGGVPRLQPLPSPSMPLACA